MGQYLLKILLKKNFNPQMKYKGLVKYLNIWYLVQTI